VELSDSVVRHLRAVVDLPDLSGTRYELEGEIGRGGLGVVYAAVDRQLGRRVAIKVLDGEEEARVIAGLEHPAIVPVYDAGVLPDGRAYYAMKLVSGERLDRYLRAQPQAGRQGAPAAAARSTGAAAPSIHPAGEVSLSERLRLLQRVGEAVAFAHTRGVLHRDLKPQNVMVGSFGEVYVMDWGVEGVAGTPQFRAPEQAAAGAALDQRADVYALGALLQFLLPAGAPHPLRAIAAKAMAADPGGRYTDVPALLLDLQRFQDGLAVAACPDTWWQQTRRFAVRNQVLLLLLAAFVVVKFFLFFLRWL